MESNKWLILLIFLVDSCVCGRIGEECNNNKGKCVMLNDCSKAKEELAKGQLPNTCFFDDGKPVVCCPKEDLPTESPLDCLLCSLYEKTDSAKKCDEYSRNLLQYLPVTDTVPNIVNGANATRAQFPHMAALGYLDTSTNRVQWDCAGTLISETFVLTAAHCLTHRTYGKVKNVRIGDVDLRDASGSTWQEFEVAFAIPHPDYDPPKRYHDIALLELNKEARFNANVKPACLYNTKDLNQYRTNSLHVSGWGTTEYGGQKSDILQYIILDLFSLQECQKTFKPSRTLPTGIDDNVQLCAGSRRNITQDACQGDSGGPIQIESYSKRLHYVVGITSFGRTCGAIGIPGVYTRVANYIDWIERIVWV